MFLQKTSTLKLKTLSFSFLWGVFLKLYFSSKTFSFATYALKMTGGEGIWLYFKSFKTINFCLDTVAQDG